MRGTAAVVQLRSLKNTKKTDAEGCKMHRSIFMIHVWWIFHLFLKNVCYSAFLFHYNFIDYCQQETKANQVRVQHLLRYFLTPYTSGIYCISPSYIRNKGTKTLNNALETNSKSHMDKNKTPACSHGPTYMWRTALLLQQQLRGR